MKSFLTFTIFFFVYNLGHSQYYSFSKAIRLSKNVNSIAEESMPLVSKDGKSLYFVRTLFRGNVGGKNGGQDIWLTKKDGNDEWNYAENISPVLNNTRNNAIIGFDSTGTVLYLLDAYSPNGTKLTGVAKTVIRDNRYLEPVAVKLRGLEAGNSFVGFYINESEDVLLVSMDAPNSIGEEDIYVCLKDEYGEWGSPINLGPTINTYDFEISPYLLKDGKTLIFASNGLDGYGECDLYMSRRLYDNSWVLWSKPINLGEEINSNGFDAYFSMTKDNLVYFVSNRNSENTDIYTSELIELTPDEMRAEINPSKYKLSEKEIQELMGMPVSRTIYFDLDSYTLKPESRELLDYLTSKLKINPEYFIELIGHTDLEGTENYNLELSKRRASEVETYMQENGINIGRISTKGVGEQRLLYKNGTPEELSKNRRVEIIITKDRL